MLVLDEPTAGLDRVQRDRVVGALRRRADAGTTVLVVSHDLAFVAETAERVVVMRDGRIAEDRPARELLYDRQALAALGLRPPADGGDRTGAGTLRAPVRAREVVEAHGRD